MRRQLISGWGRCPQQLCEVQEPTSVEVLQELVLRRDAKSCIARGCGRSYGDSSLNDLGRVITQIRLNRFLAFDPAGGLLEVEAGVTLAEIIEDLLPRGWFLPTTPGTKFVTVGGAIAADIHGKNHHVDGTFGQHIRALRLLTANGEVVECTPSVHSDIFWATVGGMGLTGIILSAKIQMQAVSSAHCQVTVKQAPDLDSALHWFQDAGESFRYSVAWIDCLGRGRSLGRSVILAADPADRGDLPAARGRRPLATPRRWGKSVPFDLPTWVVTPSTARLFNAVYYARHRDGCSLLDFDSYFFPLDHVANWNRVYGKRGFIQYQALFPKETSHRGLVELLEKISSSRAASFLAVLKRAGPAGDGMLSYLHEGYTLALDLPNTGDDLVRLCGQLDELLLRYGGRLYLAKDAMTTPAAFSAMYPRLGEFRAVKHRVDPEQKFDSSQARRVGITDR